jgi:ribosome-binding protein aMBF1 (putative translation factor)
MSDQTPNGEPQGGEQTAGKPTDPVTPPGEKQTSDGSELTLENVYQKVLAIEKSAGKRQSAKDKAIDKLDKKVDGLIERYEEKRQSGMSPEQAQHALDTEDMLAAYKSGEFAPPQVEQPTGQATPPDTPKVDAQVLLTATGLSDSDPEVTKILKDQADPTAALVELSAKRKKPAAPQTVMPSSGGSTPAPANVVEDYQKEIKEARLHGDDWKVAQIQAKYRKEHGLEV